MHTLTTTKGPNGKEVVNVQANLIAHAVVGAVTSYASGNPALAGASGAAMGEYIAQQMYPGVKREDLSEEQRQTISALGTLAAGLAGGVAGDSASGAVAGKNAVENNALGNDDDELQREHGNRPVKVIPINPMKTGIVDDAGNVLGVGGKVISINIGQQNKHISGSNEYKTAAASSGSQRSILTADPKSLLPQLGTGQQVGKVEVGLAGSKE
ncbi:VENN motif pre-toxin domain-containing protein [Pantoea agglomerans]|nr:VENN motif pre-toxin domain-containing protein [Pantoea agglomerans]